MLLSLKSLLAIIAKYDPAGAARLVRELTGLGIKFGVEYDGDLYVMFKLRNTKLHPQVGVQREGWMFGAGYDINPNVSMDLYVRKDWNLKGKPKPGVGVSFRF
jgi:hypothetical protein